MTYLELLISFFLLNFRKKPPCLLPCSRCNYDNLFLSWRFLYKMKWELRNPNTNAEIWKQRKEVVTTFWNEFKASFFFCFLLQIRRRRPTPATLVASSDQSSPGKNTRHHKPVTEIHQLHEAQFPVSTFFFFLIFFYINDFNLLH